MMYPDIVSKQGRLYKNVRPTKQGQDERAYSNDVTGVHFSKSGHGIDRWFATNEPPTQDYMTS